jgi:hypothetical protein
MVLYGNGCITGFESGFYSKLLFKVFIQGFDSGF